MPEYMKKRFGGKRIRIYLAIIALLLSIFTKIAVQHFLTYVSHNVQYLKFQADLFAGSILIKQILDWNLYAAIGLQLAVACISTVSGTVD